MYDDDTPNFLIEQKQGIIRKTISFLPNYLIRNDGRIINKNNSKFIKPIQNDNNFLQVKLNDKLYFVHELVAKTFIPNNDESLIIKYKNHNILDNHVDNLEWIINTKIKERILYEYSEKELLEINDYTNIVLLEIKISHNNDKSKIFENQKLIADKVVMAFKNRTIINVMLIAKTQSGKTGSMCATIQRYLQDPDNCIPIQNIYIISGLSSCEWKEQTKDRIPNYLQKRIFHRDDLLTLFVNDITNKKNVLIIMDEIQVAAMTGQTIYNAFEKAGFLDKNKLYENDIKILEYSATPDGTIYDLQKWHDASEIILAEPGKGYTSSYDLYNLGRVKQYKKLDKENIKEIQDDIEKFSSKRYHLIRTNSGTNQDKTIIN